MGDLHILHQTAAAIRRKAAKSRHVPAEDEKLLGRMRRVWRRPDDMLSDIEKILREGDEIIADRTFRAWWSRQHRISWAGGKLIERAIKYRMEETRAACRSDEVTLKQSANVIDRRAWGSA